MKQYTSIFAGIDVSKAHLDVYLHPTGACRCFDNDQAGWRSLRRWLTDAHPQGVVYEATGSYHKGMERYLGEQGFPIARLDPRRARRFAEALGVNAKTDPVDARVLAEFGAFLNPGARHTPLASRNLSWGQGPSPCSILTTSAFRHSPLWRN